MEDTYAKLKALQPDKYMLAVIGEANAGKTTTLTKAYYKLKSEGKISNITCYWGKTDIRFPTSDFLLKGITVYGLTGIISQGDQICYLKKNLERLAKENAQVILCACRKQAPDTYKSVAEISWKYGYNIIWIDLSCPSDMSLDAYTTRLSVEIADLF